MENQEYWCLISCSDNYDIVYLDYTYYSFVAKVLAIYKIYIDTNEYIKNGYMYRYGDYIVVRLLTNHDKKGYKKQIRKYSIKEILE
jgi:hypothetical protein